MKLLLFHTKYSTIEIALYTLDTANNPFCLRMISFEKQKCTHITQYVTDLLQEMSLFDIDCIAINLGPGPLMTLRTVITFVNGLSWGLKKPLIGVDGLHAFLLEQHNPIYTHSIAMINAFGQEIYYGSLIHKNLQYTSAQYTPEMIITSVEKIVAEDTTARINFIGNSPTTHPLLERLISHNQFYQSSEINIHAIALNAYIQWENNKSPLHHFVAPLTFEKGKIL